MTAFTRRLGSCRAWATKTGDTAENSSAGEEDQFSSGGEPRGDGELPASKRTHLPCFSFAIAVCGNEGFVFTKGLYGFVSGVTVNNCNKIIFV